MLALKLEVKKTAASLPVTEAASVTVGTASIISKANYKSRSQTPHALDTQQPNKTGIYRDRRRVSRWVVLVMEGSAGGQEGEAGGYNLSQMAALQRSENAVGI